MHLMNSQLLTNVLSSTGPSDMMYNWTEILTAGPKIQKWCEEFEVITKVYEKLQIYFFIVNTINISDLIG